MKIDEKTLIEEIKTLKRASEIHTKYSIEQYKKVLKLLQELEKEKKSLEKKVKQRTIYLEKQIEENKKLTKRLEELATYDPLTRLLNRRAFIHKLNELKNSDFSVMFLDLDGFKQVNDIYGHKAGDELLKIVSIRLINALRKEDIVARFGGDEFVVIIKGKKSKKDLEIIAKKLIEKISEPIVIDGITARVGTSIGIYIYNKKDPINKVLSFADAAMYKAKHSGKGKYIFFNPYFSKYFIQDKIKKALKKGNLEKEYILIYDKDKIFAKELIIELDKLSFKDILEAIEEDKKLLEEITLFMLKDIKEKTIIHLHYKLFNDNFLEKIKNLNLDFSKICLSVYSSNLKYIKLENLKKFKKSGFKIVLDRFEDVHCALTFLEYPIDAFKIDLETALSTKDEKIIKGLLDIAKSLNIKMIVKCGDSFCIKN